MIKFVFLFLLIPSLCQADITSNLVAHLKFDEGTGISAADASGNSNTGTLQSTTAWVTGKIGAYATSYNGTSDYTNVPAAGSINNLSPMTVAFWYNTSSFTSCGNFNGAFVEKQSFIHGWLFACASTGNKTAMTIYTNANALVVFPNVTIATGGWHHLAFTWGGTLDGSDAKMYYDGSDVTSISQAGTGTRIDDSTKDIHIAKNQYDGQFFNGYVDDVRIYSRALSSSDITELYNYTGAPTDTSVKGFWGGSMKMNGSMLFK